MKVAGPPPIATSLARSMGSIRRTSQINESIKINNSLKSKAFAGRMGIIDRDSIESTMQSRTGITIVILIIFVIKDFGVYNKGL